MLVIEKGHLLEAEELLMAEVAGELVEEVLTMAAEELIIGVEGGLA